MRARIAGSGIAISLGVLASPAPPVVSSVPAHRQDPRVFPFRPSPAQRRATARDRLPRFWDDGKPCSVGCRPRGAIRGWPLRGFHRQHALRAGLNELRAGSFHVGVDIQAFDGSRVYAIQPGRAHILVATGRGARVRVGNFIYWHIHPKVREGEFVPPYRTVVGTVYAGEGHLHLSEVGPQGRYLNPLRPGGRVLSPWRDTAAPVLGRPELRPDGRVLIRAFDRQSYAVRTTYETPVLAPAALAYRVFDSRGRAVTPLRFALRGSQLLDLPFSRAREVFTPDAHPASFQCLRKHVICKPDWHYVLAGGLAPPLERASLPAGTYRLTAYAWDWAGNTRARDVKLSVP